MGLYSFEKDFIDFQIFHFGKAQPEAFPASTSASFFPQAVCANWNAVTWGAGESRRKADTLGCVTSQRRGFLPQCPAGPGGRRNLPPPGTDGKLLFPWILFKTWPQWEVGREHQGRGETKKGASKKSLKADTAGGFVTELENFAGLLG